MSALSDFEPEAKDPGIRYVPVSPKIWNKATLRLGWKVFNVYVYLIVNDNRHTEGLYRVPLGYVTTDLEPLGITADDVERAIKLLQDQRLIVYDAANDVVFLPDALSTQPPASLAQIKGAIRRLRRLPQTPLMKLLWIAATVYAPKFADAIAREFPGIEKAEVTLGQTASRSLPRGFELELGG